MLARFCLPTAHPKYSYLPIPISVSSYSHIRTRNLTLKSKAGTNLVAGLVEFLGIEGTANAEGEALVDLNVVCEGEDAAVVDLGLGKRHGVDLVLAGNLQADSTRALGVIQRLDTSLGARVRFTLW